MSTVAWVLIMTINYNGYKEASYAIGAAEFNSEMTCEAAGRKFKEMNEHGKYFCTKK